jgi:fatty acid-binding protein DegV
MSNKVLYGNDAVDPEDISILNGEQCINAAGIVKMLCMAAYHQEKGSAGQIKNETALDRLLKAASAKGFAKEDILRTAFAMTCPPSWRAKQLANELAAHFGLAEMMQTMGGTIIGESK